MRHFSLLRNIFSVTSWMIILNVTLFIVFSIISIWYPSIINFLALKPSNVVDNFAIWVLLTSMFLHGSIVHLFVNMFTLFFLGGLAEKIVGWKRFIGLYIISGLVGGLFFVLFAYFGSSFSFGERVFGGIDDLAVGASGALFGLLGILAVLIPNYTVILVAGPIIVIILQIVFSSLSFSPAVTTFISLLLNILLIVMLFGVFSRSEFLRKISVMISMPLWVAPFMAIIPLVIVSFFVDLPIGNTAHFGGLVAGLIYGFILLKKYPKKVNLLRSAFRRLV